MIGLLITVFHVLLIAKSRLETPNNILSRMPNWFGGAGQHHLLGLGDPLRVTQRVVILSSFLERLLVAIRIVVLMTVIKF